MREEEECLFSQSFKLNLTLEGLGEKNGNLAIWWRRSCDMIESFCQLLISSSRTNFETQALTQKNNRYKDFTLCSFVCTLSLCVWDFPITAQRHAVLMKWRLPPSSPNSVRNLVKASQWYFSVASLSYQLRVLYYQIFRRKCRHLQSSQTQQKVTERVVRLCGGVGVSPLLWCCEPWLVRCNLA